MIANVYINPYSQYTVSINIVHCALNNVHDIMYNVDIYRYDIDFISTARQSANPVTTEVLGSSSIFISIYQLINQ